MNRSLLGVVVVIVLLGVAGYFVLVESDVVDAPEQEAIIEEEQDKSDVQPEQNEEETEEVVCNPLPSGAPMVVKAVGLDTVRQSPSKATYTFTLDVTAGDRDVYLDRFMRSTEPGVSLGDSLQLASFGVSRIGGINTRSGNHLVGACSTERFAITGSVEALGGNMSGDSVVVVLEQIFWDYSDIREPERVYNLIGEGFLIGIPTLHPPTDAPEMTFFDAYYKDTNNSLGQIVVEWDSENTSYCSFKSGQPGLDVDLLEDHPTSGSITIEANRGTTYTIRLACYTDQSASDEDSERVFVPTKGGY